MIKDRYSDQKGRDEYLQNFQFEIFIGKIKIVAPKDNKIQQSSKLVNQNFQNNFQMGNECCQQQKISVYQIDVSSKLKKQQFMPVQIPKDDIYLAQKIIQYKQLNTAKVMKHVTLDKYYWGQWQQGAPFGDGFLYFPQKYFYRGKFNLKPNYYGEIQFISTGLKYKGEISQGRAEGTGTLTHKEGLYFYEGIWKNSQPVTGIMIIKQSAESDKKTIANFDDFPIKDTKIIYPDGKIYVGTIHSRNFMPEGRGKVTYEDGTAYEGQWTEGMFHGDGIYSWPDGSSYDGSYQYGHKHGFGKYIYPSKKIYQGQWIKGCQHGRGTLTNPLGTIIKKGIWNMGKFLTTDEV